MNMIHQLIGADATSITWWQMTLRGVLIFLYTLFLVRIADRRVFGKQTSFDIVLGVILGSIMSRALTGNARFFPTLAAATTLVALHWLLAAATTRHRWFGYLIKGNPILLLKDGELQSDAMKHANLTENDLLEALRSNGGTTDPAEVKEAHLERSGDVSVVSR